MNIRVKKLNENAVLPTKSTIDAAGYDLTVTEITTEVGEDGVMMLVYHTGLSLEIPKHYAGFLFNRSSIAKKSLVLTNCVGVIDADYRGEIVAKFKVNTTSIPAIFKPGDKFAQIIILPLLDVNYEFISENDDLTQTERGTGGYGSTDEKEMSTNNVEHTNEEEIGCTPERNE